MKSDAPPKDTLEFLGTAIWQGNIDMLVAPPREAVPAGVGPDAAAYDHGTVRLTDVGTGHVEAALAWLEEQKTIGLTWPATDAATEEVERFRDYFKLAALLMEAYNDVPGLRPRQHKTGGGPAESVEAKLTQRLHKTLREGHDREGIGRMITAFKEQLTMEPCPVERDLDERLSAVKQLIAFYTMFVMSRYRIMKTPQLTLVEIDKTLRRLARTIEQIAAAAAKRAHALRSAHRMHAIFGLVFFHRARVLRALGGGNLPMAMRCLAASLQYYEDRSSSIAEPRDEDGRRNADYYHASLVLLQEAYYFLLQGMLNKAASTLRSGRLLSRAVRNTVHDSEFELIALSIERSRLRRPASASFAHADVVDAGVRDAMESATPSAYANDPANAIDDVRANESEKLAERLERNYAVHHYYRRPTYARMNRYQAALLHDFRGDPTRARAAAQAIMNGLKIAAPTDQYWIASTHLLLLSLAISRARQGQTSVERRWDHAGRATHATVQAPAVRDDPLNYALKEGDLAIQVIGDRTDFEHLRADCNSRLAEVAVLRHDWRAAEKYMRAAVPTSTAGYTTNANVTAALILIRAEMELRRDNLRHALALLERFRDMARPHLETGRLLDYHDMLEREASQPNPLEAFLVTDQTVATLSATPDAYAELKRRLQRFLLASGRRVFGSDVSDRRLADKLGVDAKTIRQFKRVAEDHEEERAGGAADAR